MTAAHELKPVAKTAIEKAKAELLAYANNTLVAPALLEEEEVAGNVLETARWLMLVNGYPRTHQYVAGITTGLPRAAVIG